MVMYCQYNIKLLGLQDIVALSGAHTLGRSRPERSGWGKQETKYTVRKPTLSDFVNAQYKVTCDIVTYNNFILKATMPCYM